MFLKILFIHHIPVRLSNFTGYVSEKGFNVGISFSAAVINIDFRVFAAD